MTDLRITPARLELLKAVTEDRVYSRLDDVYMAYTVGSLVRARMVSARMLPLRRSGLVVFRQRGFSRRAEVTDKGREVLARYTQDGEGK